MPNLEHAIMVAASAHHLQKDKAGEPYILHPLRVMLTQATEAARIVAVLHDTVEDTDMTLKRLKVNGFSDEVIEAVDALTKRPDETYREYIENRVVLNPLATRVKLADLADNMNLDRLPNPSPTDWQRYVKYREARTFLLLRTRY